MAVSIKDYAASRGVAYEAVRRQLITYADDLEGHIIVAGNKRMLDDEAVSFLDSKRSKPVVVMAAPQVSDLESSSNEEVLALRQTIDDLRGQLIAAQQRVIELQQLEIVHAEELAQGKAAINQVRLLTDQNQSLTSRNEEIVAQNAVLEEQKQALSDDKSQLMKERDEAKNEAQSYVKTIFGLYRKKK